MDNVYKLVPRDPESSTKKFIDEIGECCSRQVNTARPKAVVNAVRTNRVNAVKASACWVWRPVKPNSASITLKRYDYVDARGRSRLGYKAAVKLHDQFDDEKRAGAELTQQNDKSQYKKRNKQEELFTHKEEMAPMALSDSKVNNDKSCSKTCLTNYETLKKQYDDLIFKLHETEFKAATYKRGLATIEDQLVTFRKNEILFSEEITVLKREVGCKNYEISVLKTEFEKVKQEKEGIEFKIEKFDNTSKSLYKFDDEKKPKSKVEKKTGVSKTVSPTVSKIEFVRPKQQEKPVRKPVKYAEMYRQVNTARPKAVVNATRTNWVNVVKALACWVWRPVKPNSASITLKRYDYGNPETELEDLVRLNSPEDKKFIYLKGASWRDDDLIFNLHETEFKAATYKRGLAIVEDQLVTFRKNEILFSEEIAVLKREVGSKWVFKNKKDEHGITTKNKARLVAQGYSQEEGINYDETFAPVARMEAIRIFLAFATYMNFKVYQMDVKSAFLNGKMKEEVYVTQPPSFESSEFPDYVCKLDKALYGLKQAPMAWYDTLSTLFIQNKFTRGRIDNTLFIYKSKGEVLIVQVYADDIIFGLISYKLCKKFEKLMTKKSEMSMIKELTYFLGLQIKQDDKGISILSRAVH
ncbi:retrovirus-related pol polyprotein from transposon TNT 1-94 [Tanacetum coccineum]